MTYYIGIDPGVAGGFGVLGTDKNDAELVGVYKMPATEGDILALAREFATWGQCVALIETLGGIPGQYDKAERVYKMRSSPKSYGVLSENRGVLRMAFMAAGIPVETVNARVWQTHFKLIRTDKSESDTAKKNRHKAKAQSLFPGLKLTHFTSDAILLAAYARMNSGVLFHQAVGA